MGEGKTYMINAHQRMCIFDTEQLEAEINAIYNDPGS